MGDASLQEDEGVGKILKTHHLMDLRGLFTHFAMKKTTKPNLVILVVFVVALGL